MEAPFRMDNRQGMEVEGNVAAALKWQSNNNFGRLVRAGGGNHLSQIKKIKILTTLWRISVTLSIVVAVIAHQQKGRNNPPPTN